VKKMEIRLSMAEQRARAAEQHSAVCSFLNKRSTYELVKERLVGSNEFILFKEMCELEMPVGGEHLEEMSASTCSEAARRLAMFLERFSQEDEFMKSEKVVITIPPKKRGGSQVGYYFACFDTTFEQLLDPEKTRDTLGKAWNELKKRTGEVPPLRTKRSYPKPVDKMLGIDESATPLAAHNPLLKYTQDFSLFVDDRLEGFKGRKWIFTQIEEHIEKHNNGYIFVKGDPGVGKSSIAAKLVRREECIHHFNIRPEGRNTVELFLKNICSQLIAKYKLGYDELPADSFKDNNLLIRILKDVSDIKTKEKEVIVVDALDEVQIDSDQLSKNILYLPMLLPQNVFILVTMRDDPSLMPRLVQEPKEILINADDKSNINDIREYIHTCWDTEEIRTYLKKMKLTMNDFGEEMVEKSQGNFMYLKYVLPEIAKGTYVNQRIPAGLTNYYDDHWKRMGLTTKGLVQNKIKILYILAGSPRPISCKLLAEYASEKVGFVQQLLNEWSQYLHKQINNDNCHYSLYHDSFREFLKRKDIVKASGVDLDSIDRGILDSFDNII